MAVHKPAGVVQIWVMRATYIQRPQSVPLNLLAWPLRRPAVLNKGRVYDPEGATAQSMVSRQSLGPFERSLSKTDNQDRLKQSEFVLKYLIEALINDIDWCLYGLVIEAIPTFHQVCNVYVPKLTTPHEIREVRSGEIPV